MLLSKSKSAAPAAPHKKIAGSTPPPRPPVASSSRPGARTPTSARRGLPGAPKEPESEKPLQLSAEDSLKLFNILENSQVPVNQSLKELARTLKIKPARNLTLAFEQSSMRFQESRIFPQSFNETKVSPDPDDDDNHNPLPDLSDTHSTTSFTVSSTAKSPVSRPCSEAGYVHSAYDALAVDAKAKYDDWHKKYVENRGYKILSERDEALPVQLIDSTNDSFQRVTPLVQKFLTKSNADIITTKLKSEKPLGLPCPFEERIQSVETLERLGKVNELLQNGFPIETFDQSIASSLQKNLEIMNRDVTSLEQVVEKIDHQLKLREQLLL